METSERKVKLNVILTPEGLERIRVIGGVDITLEAMEFYRSIAGDVLEIDKKIKKSSAAESRTREAIK